MTFHSFDSLEDAWAAMATAEQAANERVTDEQRAIKPGDYVLRPTQYAMIFGEIFTEEEFLRREKAAGGEMDEEEIAESRAQWRDRLERGFVFGSWHSVLEPNGELGDAHISTLGPVISKRLFEEMVAKFKAAARR
jgi:hypothetical protein